MTQGLSDRRQFLQTVAGGAIAGMFPPGYGTASPYQSHAGDFMLADGLTYLNTGTIGPCRRETLDATVRAWSALETNPIAHYGRFAGEPLIQETRTIAARFLGADVDEIAITTSTTSGMNAIAQGLRLRAGDRVLLPDQEHAGGLLCWKYLAKYHGIGLDVVTIPLGEFRSAEIMRSIEAAMQPRTKVISLSHVFSSTGLRMPVREVAALARSKGAICVVDGAQSVGAIRVNVRELGCHAYATSGHKWLLGPKGTGILYIARDAQQAIRPMAFEEGFATYNNANGVVNLPGIIGLGAAIRHLESARMERIESHNLGLALRLREQLAAMSALRLVSPPAEPLAASLVTAVLPERIDHRAFVTALLEQHRIAIRPTHPEFGFNGIRFSVHEFNTGTDVDRAAEAVRVELAANG